MLILKNVKMKSKIIRFFVIAGFFTATVTSCYKDDFDELQKQVDELEGKVAENTKAIQEQIMTQIAALQADLTTLAQETQDSFTGVESSLGDITASLESISSDVENNAKSVFYGNLITDEDYTAYKDAGADVVTGKVIITTKEQAQTVSNCRWIGSDLITELGSLEGIQNVGGDVIVNSDTVSIIELKGLLTIGGDFKTPQSSKLISVTANELVAITGLFSIDGGTETFNKVSMTSLELVGSIYINGQDNNSTTGKAIIALDWNSPVVAGDLEIKYLDNEETSVSDVLGDVSISYCDINIVNFEGTKINGEFYFSWNTTETINALNVEIIKGDVEIESNNASGGIGIGSTSDAGEGLSKMAFDALKLIDGDVSVENNKGLFDIFNSVSIVAGDIQVKAKVPTGVFIVFESLIEADEITLFDEAQIESVKGFNKLTTCESINLGNEKYVVVKTLEVFNSITNLDEYNVNIHLYRQSSMYPTLDLSNSFKSLVNAFKINIFGYSRYSSYSNTTTYYDSEIAAGAFPALKSCGTILLNGKIGYDDGFAALDSISNVFLDNGANAITLPVLTKVSSYMKVFVRNANEDVNLTFPSLISAKDVLFYGYEAGADITMDAPELKQLKSFKYYNNNTDGGSPVKIDAPMPKLTEITAVDLNFKNAVTPVDVTNMLTGLTTLVDAGYYTKVYLQYINGQTFCGMATFLKNIDLDTFGRKVTFKEDGTTQNDAEAITKITTCI